VFTIYGKDNAMADQPITDRIAVCDKLAFSIFDALSTKNSKAVKKDLAFGFTFMGQKFPLAKMVFNAAIEQLGGEYANVHRISEDCHKGILTLEYEFLFSLDPEKKARTATFHFNKANKIVEIVFSMFKVGIDTSGENMAQDESEAKPLTIIPSNEDIVTIPIELIADLPFVTARINGVQRRLMFDSGAGNLILNSKYFEHDVSSVDTECGGKVLTMTGSFHPDGSGDIIENTHITDFDFYGICFTDAAIPMLDLTHLERIIKTDIYGLIGYEIFKGYDVLYDYPNNTIQLIKPEVTGAYVKWVNDEFPFVMLHESPHIKMKIGDTELLLGLDSGCSSLSIDAKYYDALLPHLTIDDDTKVAGVTKKKKVLAGVVDEVKIGNMGFYDVSVIFDGHGCMAGSDGVFGFPILAEQKVLVRYREKVMGFG